MKSNELLKMPFLERFFSNNSRNLGTMRKNVTTVLIDNSTTNNIVEHQENAG